jgi:two-component system cell cycle sensor histidine kinase PleC
MSVMLPVLPWTVGAALAALALWLAARLARAEGRAREAETRLRHGLEAIPGAALIYDADERLVECNAEARRQHVRFGVPVEAGVSLVDVLGAMAQSGLAPAARGREADWIAERLAQFRAAAPQVEERFIGDRWFDLHFRRLEGGGRLVLRLDVSEARRREAASAESERRFRELAEVSSDWFWRSDAEHRFLPAARDNRRGIGPGSPGSRRWEIADPKDLAAEPEKWARHKADLEARREFRDFRYWAIDRDGRRLFVRTSGRPMFDEAGVFLGYRGVSSDLTPQVEAEDRAATAQARLAEALENLPLGIALYDREERLVVCNSTCREFFPQAAPLMVAGQARRAILATAAERGDVAGWKGRGDAWFAETQRRVEQGDATIELSLPDGRWLTRLQRATSEGGLVVVYADVTALKRHESELGEKTAQMQIVFENLAEGVSVVDGELNTIAFNSTGLRLLGFPERFPYFADYIRYNAERGEYGPGDVEQQVAERVALARQFVPHAFERTRPDGTVLEIRGNPVPGGGFVTTYRDVTEQRRVEETLRRAKEQAELASRAKSEFLANTSHELRTPLNAILGFSEILMQQMFGPLGAERYLEYARDIHQSGAHLLSIINDLLDLAKVEAGRFEMQEEAIPLSAMLEGAARFVRDRADAGGVRLSLAVEADAPQLFCDQRALKQIVVNLLSNAVKFTTEGGRVEVSARLAPDGWLDLAVADTGIGMTAHDIEVALTPFGQVESALTRRFEGTGLGLPLARRFVELHGGTLGIESKPGEGTVVTARFPPDRLIWPEPTRSAGGG